MRSFRLYGRTIKNYANRVMRSITKIWIRIFVSGANICIWSFGHDRWLDFHSIPRPTWKWRRLLVYFFFLSMLACCRDNLAIISETTSSTEGKSQSIMALLGRQAQVWYFASGHLMTCPGTIFAHSYESLTNCSSLCAAKCPSHDAREAHKRSVHSQKVLSHFAVSSLDEKTTRGIKGRHDSVNIGTGLPR